MKTIGLTIAAILVLCSVAYGGYRVGTNKLQELKTSSHSAGYDQGFTRGLETGEFNTITVEEYNILVDDYNKLKTAAQSYSAPKYSPLRCASNTIGDFTYTNCN